MKNSFREIPTSQIESGLVFHERFLPTTSEAFRLFLSIRDYGIFQPLLVTELEKDHYKIIDGELRLSIATELGINRVPCLVKPKMSEKERETLRFQLYHTQLPLTCEDRKQHYRKVKNLLNDELIITGENCSLGDADRA